GQTPLLPHLISIDAVGGNLPVDPALNCNLRRPWPTPPLASCAGRTFYFTNHGQQQQLGRTPDGALYMGPNRMSWETWAVDDAGNGRVFLRSTEGPVLSSNAAGVVSSTTNRGATERWLIDIANSGDFLITSEASRMHLGARPDGSLYTG